MEDENIINSEEFKKFLSTKNCRGCFNHCSLSKPNCGRSKIWIKDAIDEFKNKNDNNQISF